METNRKLEDRVGPTCEEAHRSPFAQTASNKKEARSATDSLSSHLSDGIFRDRKEQDTMSTGLDNGSSGRQTFANPPYAEITSNFDNVVCNRDYPFLEDNGTYAFWIPAHTGVAINARGANYILVDARNSDTFYHFSERNFGSNLIFDYGGTEDTIDISSFKDNFDTEEVYPDGSNFAQSIFLNREGDHLTIIFAANELGALPQGKITLYNQLKLDQPEYQIETLLLSTEDEIVEEYDLVALAQKLKLSSQSSVSLYDLINDETSTFPSGGEELLLASPPVTEMFPMVLSPSVNTLIQVLAGEEFLSAAAEMTAAPLMPPADPLPLGCANTGA